ncbi:MAG: phosphatase PAP2 family protein [Allobaculum sp.]|nr:phosphatase PAP2 family protein [Allobaculum sp.]
METQRKIRISNVWLLVCLALGLLGLILGTFIDLPLDQMLYHPDVFWAQFLAAAGPAPIFWCIGAAGFLIIDVLNGTSNSIPGWVLGFFLLLIGPVYMGDSFVDEMAMDWKMAWVIGLLLSTLPALVYYFLMRHTSRKDKIQCIWILLIVCLGSLVVVQVAKRLWVRPRYFVIAETGGEVPFVPWYSIDRSLKTQFAALYEQEHDFFRSFPSGHSQSVTCLFLWALIPVYTQKGNENIVMGLALVLSWFTMFSRLVVGAHFLSDISAGYLITFSLFAGCCWFFGLTKGKSNSKPRKPVIHRLETQKVSDSSDLDSSDSLQPSQKAQPSLEESEPITIDDVIYDTQVDLVENTMDEPLNPFFQSFAKRKQKQPVTEEQVSSSPSSVAELVASQPIKPDSEQSSLDETSINKDSSLLAGEESQVVQDTLIIEDSLEKTIEISPMKK